MMRYRLQVSCIGLFLILGGCATNSYVGDTMVRSSPTAEYLVSAKLELCEGLWSEDYLVRSYIESIGEYSKYRAAMEIDTYKALQMRANYKDRIKKNGKGLSGYKKGQLVSEIIPGTLGHYNKDLGAFPVKAGVGYTTVFTSSISRHSLQNIKNNLDFIPQIIFDETNSITMKVEHRLPNRSAPLFYYSEQLFFSPSQEIVDKINHKWINTGKTPQVFVKSVFTLNGCDDNGYHQKLRGRAFKLELYDEASNPYSILFEGVSKTTAGDIIGSWEDPQLNSM